MATQKVSNGNANRSKGYYWVRVRRTKLWCILYWMPSLNNGKGYWDKRMFENDTRGGFDKIYPVRLTPPPEEDLIAFGLLPPKKQKVIRTRTIEPKIKRTRRDVPHKRKRKIPL